MTRHRRVVFMRHGLSMANIHEPKLFGAGILAALFTRDPELVPDSEAAAAQGRSQTELAFGPAANEGVDLVLCSVLLRAIESAYLAFVKTGLVDKLVVAPHISETPSRSLRGKRFPEHNPRARAEQMRRLRQRWGEAAANAVDWSLLDAYGPPEAAFPSNLDSFRTWLLAHAQLKQHRNIVVVSHSNIIKARFGGERLDNFGAMAVDIETMSAMPQPSGG